MVSSVIGLKGVQKVQDVRQYLDPFFKALNFVQWGTIAASALLDLQVLLGLSSDHVEISLTDSLTDPAGAPVRPQGSPLPVAAAEASLSRKRRGGS